MESKPQKRQKIMTVEEYPGSNHAATRAIPLACLGIEITLDDIYGNLPDIPTAS